MVVWSRRSLAVALVTLAVGAPAIGEAQAFNYPSLQTPQASTRDYTAALVGGAGTTLLFQWREGASRGMHWQLDAGLADPTIVARFADLGATALPGSADAFGTFIRDETAKWGKVIQAAHIKI